MEFAVLGPLQVSGANGPIDVASAKERAVLAHLVANAGRVVTADELIETLWDGHPPRSAAKSLQNYVLRLRNALEPERHGSPQTLVTDGQGYRLAVPDDAIDARRFVRLVELGRRAYREGHPDAASATLGEALALWRGPAYAGFESTGFGGGESRRLEELRLVALEDRLAAELDLDHARETVPELESLVHEHPWRERLWHLLVLALYRSGRQADALATYARMRDMLVDELGVEPGEALRLLHEQVLAQDPSLLILASGPTLPAGLVPPPGPFVGRDGELASLRLAWIRAAGGESVTVVVRGSRGSGARRLAGEFAAEVAETGARVVLVTDAETTPDNRVEEPTLVIVTGDAARSPSDAKSAGPRLTLVLAGRAAPVPVGAEAVDLAPIGPDDVRTILATYLDPAAVADALPDVLRQSGGLPGRVHDTALGLARRRVAARVGEAAARTDEIHRALDEARGDLREGVTEFRGVVERRDAVAPDVCPWKGLAAYGVADAPWFAGRERLVAELLVRLAPARLLAVVGASGSGKSSLLHAGLLAGLAQGALPGSEGWVRLSMRPGPHPMRELVRVALRGVDNSRDRVVDLLEQMVYGDDAAARAVLVVDQLEEVWTECTDPAERAAFLSALADVVESDTHCAVVLGVRADYVGELADQSVLAGALVDATVLVGAPSEAEVRRAVDRPAERAGLTLDVGLADALVADAGDEPGSLPLLSTALTELWEHRAGRRLTLAAYSAAGGIRGAVARIAERAYGALDAHDQAATRVLLLRLAGPGEGEAVTRRRVPLAELEALPDPRVRAVVDPLAQARLLSLSAGRVEVAHEALFREWPRLHGWLEEDAAARAVRRRLVESAAEWDAGGREPSEVWRGTRLAAGTDLAAAHPDQVTDIERAFLEAGRARHDAERRAAEERAASATRQNRRLRWLLGGLGLLLVAALVSGVLAVQAGSRAESEARVATARELAAASVANLASDPELSTLLALESVEQTTSRDGQVLPEAEEALHRAVTASRTVMTVDGIGGLVEWSPAGGIFVTEGEEQSGLIDVRDAETGGSVLSWPGHDPDVNGLAFSPDGSMLATVGDDGAARVWDPTTGVELAASQGPPDSRVQQPSFSPDGSLLAAPWMDDGFVRVIDTATGGTVRDIEVAGSPRCASFSPDGTRLAICHDNYPSESEVLVVDPLSGEPLASLGRDAGAPFSAEWSPDGRWLVSGGLDTVARVWDVESNSLSSRLTGHTGAINKVAWSADSTRLATGSEDGTAKVWVVDTEGLREQLEVSGRSTASGVAGVAFSPDGERLITGASASLATTVWDVGPRGGQEWATFPAAPTGYTGVDFAPDGRQVAATTGDATVAIWDLESGQQVVRTGSHGPPEDTFLGPIDVSPDGSLVATVANESTRVWDAATGVEAFPVPSGGGWKVVWSPDGEFLATTGTEEGLTVVVDRSGELVAELQHPPGLRVDSIAFTPDGRLLATGGLPEEGVQNRVTLWDWRRGEVATEVELPGWALGLAFDPTGTYMAVSDPDEGAIIWETATGREVVSLVGHRAGVYDVAFSPDGTTVATGSRDGTIRLWDPETGLSRLELRVDQGPVWAVRFSPDGSKLASSHGDGFARVWALDLDDLVALAEDGLTRGLTEAECRQYLHVDTCDTPGS